MVHGAVFEALSFKEMPLHLVRRNQADHHHAGLFVSETGFVNPMKTGRRRLDDRRRVVGRDRQLRH